jgi:hypothetical protein
MKQNMSFGDRVFRGIIGIAALLIALFFASGTWDIVIYVFAGLMLATSFAGICPLYLAFHLSTKKQGQASPKLKAER